MDNQGPGQPDRPGQPGEPDQPDQPQQPSSYEQPTEPVSQYYGQPTQPTQPPQPPQESTPYTPPGTGADTPYGNDPLDLYPDQGQTQQYAQQPQYQQPEQPQYQQPEQPQYQQPQYQQPEQSQQYQQPTQQFQQPQYQPYQPPTQPMQGEYQQPQYQQYQQPTQQFPPGYEQQYQQQYPYQQPVAPPPAAPAKKGFPIWGIILIVILALCACGGIGTFGLLNATGRSLSNIWDQALSQAAATLTAAAVVDVVPTATPADFGLEPEATDTVESLAESTDTPESEAEGTSTPSSSTSGEKDDQIEYLTEWTNWLASYGTAFSAFGLLNIDPKLGDATWRDDVSKQLDVIRDTANKVQDYNKAPDSYAEAHSKMQEAATHFLKMTDLYEEGVDKQDADLITQANAELEQGNKVMEEVYTKMGEAPGMLGSATVTVEDTPTPEAGVESNPTSAPVTGGELGIGSTGETDGLKITVNGVKRETGGFFPPKEGMEYLILDLSFENTTDSEQTVSSLLSFNVKDGTGQEYSITFGPDIKESPDGTIAPHDTLRGESAFEVPKGATGLVFTYEPFLTGEPISFKLDK
jgi:hypothetical protein